MDLYIKSVILNGVSTDIVVQKGKILEVGQNLRTEEKSFNKIIDGSGKLIFPFLHNGHTHSPMVLLRGYGDDMALYEWLKTRIWPVEAKLTEEDYLWGNKLAIVEMIKSGTGFFNEMYMNPLLLIKALEGFPMKAQINFPIIDGLNEETAKQQIENCLKFFETVHFPENIKPGLALHSVYANSEYSLKWVADFARKNTLPIHIHMSETKGEVEQCKKDHGLLTPFQYLDSLNFFAENTVYGAHCVWLEEADFEIMKNHHIVAVHNPVSNMKLASGNVFPYKTLKDFNIPMALGTDGAASNNNLDMLEEMKIAALLQKHHSIDPTLMTAEEIFYMATKDSAKIFGTGSGEIEKGGSADFMLVDSQQTAMTPLTNPFSNMVYGINGSSISHLICNGHVLMEDYTIDGEEEIRTEAAKCAARLVEI